MKLSIFFAILAGAGVIWNIVTTIRIYDDLRRRKIPVSFIWFRVQIPKHVFQYKKITSQEHGKPGPLFYHWIISINLVLLFGLAVVIVKLA